MNQVLTTTGLGQISAKSNSMLVFKDTIHTFSYVLSQNDSNTTAQRSIYARFDTTGSIIDSCFIGDKVKGYRAWKILNDSSGSIYLIGGFDRDSSGNQDRIGYFIQKINNDVLQYAHEYRDSRNYVDLIINDAILLSEGRIALTGWLGLEGDSIQPGNPGFPDTDILLIILDSVGNLLLQKRFGDNTAQDIGYGMANGNKGRILIAGGKSLATGTKKWILEVDDQGNIVNELVSAGLNIPAAFDIHRTLDKGMVYSSVLPTGPAGPRNIIYKIDSSFNPQWQTTLSPYGSIENLILNLDEDKNGNIFVVGRQSGVLFDPDTSGNNAFLAKVSPNGDSLWVFYYGLINVSTLKDKHSFTDISIINENIYLIGNLFAPNGPLDPKQQIWLVKIDTNGCPHPDCVTGIENISLSNDHILIYPNPTKDLLNVQFDNSSGEASFKLYDLQGRLQIVKTLQKDKSIVSLHKLPQGLYIYEIGNANQFRRGKIVKE